MAWRARAAPLAVLAVLLVACPRGAKPPPADVPRPGGTLSVAVRAFESFDPVVASAREGFLALSQVFDSLTAIEPATGAVEPAAAASWRSSPDGLTWRFRIAEATYHDGTPVTAADFEAAFDRISRRRTRSDSAFQLEHVRGFRASRVTGTASTLAGVSTQGAATLVIRLERPFAELPYFLSHPALAPLAPAHRGSASKLRRLAHAPVGNGPFRVVEATPRKSASLERFDAYRGEAPYLDGLQLTVSDLDEGYRALTEGRIDVADVPAAAIESARARYGTPGFTPLWSTLSFSLNLRLEKYRKPEVRRAISLAIDRRAIAETVYGNTREPATGIVPAGVRAHDPDICGGACEADRDRARQIVRAAFGARPPRIAVDHLRDRSSSLVARAIALDLQAVGFRTTLRPYTASEYQRLLRDRRQDFAEVGWIADVPSPDGFLAQELRTGSPENHAGFSDPAFDRAIDNARRTLEEGRRLRLYRAAERRALEQMPLVPIVFFRNRTVAAERVRGFTLDGAGLFDASVVWLAR